MKIGSVEITPLDALLATLGVLCCVGGNAGQVISLNFWLNAFPGKPAPFTVLTLVASTVFVMDAICLIAWLIYKRPDMKFAFSLESIAYNIGCGFCYSVNGVLLVYATHPTPELMQVVLISTVIFWTFVAAAINEVIQRGLRRLHLVDRRVIVVPIAFGLCVAGIIVSAGSFDLSNMTYDAKKWTIIFAGAQVPGAVYNVVAGEYLKRFSRKPTPPVVEQVADNGSRVIKPYESGYGADVIATEAASSPRRRRQSDPVTVKLVLITFSALAQVAFLWIYFPLDWLHGFGFSDTMEEAKASLVKDYKCVFECTNGNYTFYLYFTAAYFATMFGLAILNHYSAPMCSMVSQLAAPTAGIILLIIPSWNVGGATYKVGSTIGALILITAGSSLYVFWSSFLQPKGMEEALEQESRDEHLQEGWLENH